ncbi:MAG: hypothetical protein AAGH89_11675 [Verrucomicrobiota bacterium]
MRITFPSSLILLSFFLLFCQRGVARADVVLTFVEREGNVRVSYEGELDLSGLSFEDTTPGTARHVIGRNTNDPQSLGIFANTFAPAQGRRTYSSPFSSVPSAPWALGATVAADEFGGDHLFFHNSAAAPLQLDPSNFIGSTWSGSGFMQFNDTTLADFGLRITGEPTYVVNNAAADSIRLTAIPEPGVAAMLCFFTMGVTMRRRR